MEPDDGYLRRAMRASSQQRHPAFDPNDDELRRAIEASEREHEIKQRERQQQQEELAAQEAAAITESTHLAGIQTESQRQEAAAEADFERILRESAAEAEQKKAAEEKELPRLHAGFGSGGGSAQARRSPRQPPTPVASRGRQRASSDATPRILAGSTGEQRQRIQTRAKNPTSPNSGPTTASPEEARSRGGDLLNRTLSNARRPFGRSNSNPNQQPARRNASARLGEIQPQDISEPPTPAPSPPRRIPHLQDKTHADRVRRVPGAPLQIPNSLGRRHSERTPSAPDPIGQRSPSSRQSPARATHREEFDAQMRLALNNSHRFARIDERYGDSHSRREDEMLRRTMEESLGDAPPPLDPSEGLLDPPPGYEDIHHDQMLDPRHYTTTNEKGNEPGYMRRITPKILEVMQRWLAEMQKFDADSKTTGKDQPPANNAFAKKRPDAEATNAGSSGNSDSAGVNDLHALLGGPRPAPAPPVQPQAVAANAFVSRMPGLATDAMTRIPTARPWDNAFSRLPTARPAARARVGPRRNGL